MRTLQFLVLANLLTTCIFAFFYFYSLGSDLAPAPVNDKNQVQLVPPSDKIPALAQGLDEKTVRMIIREELEALNKPDATQVKPDPHNEEFVALDRALRDDLSFRIESFVSLGTISQSEIDAIYQDIGGLPEKERELLMQKLARAINLNQLDLQFN